MPFQSVLRSKKQLNSQYQKIQITYSTQTFTLTPNQISYSFFSLNQYSIFMLRDDFILYQINLIFSESDELDQLTKISKSIDLKTILNANNITEITPGKGLFSCHFAFCTIITHLGGFYFFNDLPIDNDLFQMKFIPQIQKRKRIESVFTTENAIFVASGYEGIDIYGIKTVSIEEQITLIKNIGHRDFPNLPLVNILKITVQFELKLLIALDENSGLHIFNISDYANPEYLMNVYFPRAISFDSYLMTFLVVANTANKIEYVAEIFVDILNRDYFFNRIYIQDIPFSDITMNANYAVLIGNDEHIIIEHSIHNKFVQKSKEFITAFTEDELVRFDFIRAKKNINSEIGSQTQFFIGLAKGEIKIFEVMESNAKMICYFENEGVKKFNLVVNASKCSIPNHNYTNCQAKQQIEITSRVSVLESDAATILIIISTLVCIAFFGGLIFYCVCNKNWANRLKKLQETLQQEKNYKNFVEVAENSQMIK